MIVSAKKTLPSFSTPGFGRNTPNTSLSVDTTRSRAVTQVVCVSSDSDPSTPSSRSVKRSSSDPSFTSEDSPLPKRRKQGEDKENQVAPFTSPQRPKGKAKETVFPIHLDIPRQEESSPWAKLDRDFPMPPLSGTADTKPPNPVTDKYPDLALVSSNRLTRTLNLITRW